MTLIIEVHPTGFAQRPWRAHRLHLPIHVMRVEVYLPGADPAT